MLTEAFGTTAQRQLLQRGRAMHDLLKDDPRYTYYGRTVGVVTPEAAPFSSLVRLVQLQGAAHYHTVRGDETERWVNACVTAGLSATVYKHWTARDGVFDTARAILSETDLPDGVRLCWVDAETVPALLQELADAANSVGVLTLAGDVLRGVGRHACVCLALNAEGRVLSCAATSQAVHEADPNRGGEFWWGMLATRGEARGARLSLLLGAHVILAAHARFGATRFFTGVQPGNAPSEAVCARMGFGPDPFNVVTAIDASALPGGALTR